MGTSSKNLPSGRRRSTCVSRQRNGHAKADYGYIHRRADTILPSRLGRRAVEVELMLVALQVSQTGALVGLILIVALLIWALS